MKSLLTAILVIQGFAVIALGFYVFNLQSQIDELHMLMPLDQEAFGSEVARSSEIEKDPVIGKINARIDNLADAVESMASGGHTPISAPVNSESDAVDSESSDLTSLDEEDGNDSPALVAAPDPSDREEAPAKTSKPRDKAPTRKRDSDARTTRNSKESKRASRASAKKSESAALAESSANKRSEAKSSRDEQSTEGNWSVNLMSFADEAVARKEAEKISSKGIAAQIKKAQVSGTDWYRIHVPGFKTKKEAQDYSESVVKKLGVSGVWVTQ